MNVAGIKALISAGAFHHGKIISVNDMGAMDGIAPLNLAGLVGMDAAIAFNKHRLIVQRFATKVNMQLILIGQTIYQRGDEYIVPTVTDTIERADKYFNEGKEKNSKGAKLLKSFSAIYATKPAPSATAARAHIEDAGIDRHASAKAL